MASAGTSNNRDIATLNGVVRANDQLYRLVELDKALPKGYRPMAIQKTLQLLSKAPKTESVTDVYKRITDTWQNRYPAFSEYYQGLSSKPIPTDSLIKDLQLQTTTPVRSSIRGQEGPTLLVNYQRLSKDKDSNVSHKYVVKWTSWKEILSTRFFAFISTLFSNPNAGFLTPQIAAIDFDQNEFESDADESSPLLPDCAKKLRSQFESIAITLKNAEIDKELFEIENKKLRMIDDQSKDVPDKEKYTAEELSKKIEEKRESMNAKMIEGSKNHRQDKIAQLNQKLESKQQLLLADRIPGENLFDFFFNNYENLKEEQKRPFFVNLSQLAFVDLFGNRDRLIKLKMNKDGQYFTVNEKGEYDFEVEEANLGNVMVKQNENDDPVLVAIDDEIDPTDDSKYLSFLKIFFNPANYPKLAEKMADSLISNEFDNGTMKEKAEKIREDLNKIGKSAFLEGFMNMNALLKEKLPEAWEHSEKAALLKESLKKREPALLHALNQRIKLYETLNRGSS